MATATATATPKRGPGRPRKIVDEPEQEAPTVILPDPDDDDEVIEDEPAQITQGDLASAIHALAKGQEALANSQVRKIPYANHKPRSSFNPTGKKKRKLSRKCYQNSYMMNINLLHDREIELLNQLKAGKYLNGLVTVRVEDKGEESSVNIIYRNKSVDERMALKSEFRNLTEFLERATKEGPMAD